MSSTQNTFVFVLSSLLKRDLFFIFNIDKRSEYRSLEDSTSVCDPGQVMDFTQDVSVITSYEQASRVTCYSVLCTLYDSRRLVSVSKYRLRHQTLTSVSFDVTNPLCVCVPRDMHTRMSLSAGVDGVVEVEDMFNPLLCTFTRTASF